MTNQTAVQGATGLALLATVLLELMPGLQSAIGEGALLRELAVRGVGYVRQIRETVFDDESVRAFDLAISLEVAQLLSADQAISHVEALVRHSNLIVFSAAIPGQGSRGCDSSERWQDEWAHEFQSRGYYAIDAIRPRIWDLDTLDAAFRQNTILYANLAGLERYPALLADRVSSLPSLRVVHPAVWAARTDSIRLRIPLGRNISVSVRKTVERSKGLA